MEEKNSKKKDIILSVLGVFILLLAVIGVTYAVFTFTGVGTKNNTITSGSIVFLYNEETNGITLTDAQPMSDSVGKVLSETDSNNGVVKGYFDFTVSSTVVGNTAISYEVYGTNHSPSTNLLDESYIKVYLTNQSDVAYSGYNSQVPVYSSLGTAESDVNGKKLYQETFTGSGSHDYRLRLWVANNYPVDQIARTFKIKVNVKISENPEEEAENPEVVVNKPVLQVAPVASSLTNKNFYAYYNMITSVTFQDSINIPDGATKWDVSAAGDNSVQAYVIDDGLGTSTYKLFIQSDGKISANEDSSNLFMNFTNLKEINGLQFLDTGSVTNMNFMFFYCINLVGLDVNSFDTSKVTSMEAMFNCCFKLTSLDLRTFDTSNVENMSGMFSSCSSLVSIDVSGFNTSKVTTMESMFEYCGKLLSLDVHNFDTSNVTNMKKMFSDLSSLTSLDVDTFDTGNVTTMEAMFSYCSKLTSLDLSNFNTSNVKSMASMFYGCGALTEVNLNNFNTSKVTTINSMFYGCNGLINLDLSSFDTSKVVNMQFMFQNCKKLVVLDLTSFTTTSTTTISSAFANTTVITQIKVSSTKWLKATSGTGATNVFSGSGVTSLTYIP